MICSVRSASCQTVKATATATVAASAHHCVAGLLARFLVASRVLLAFAGLAGFGGFAGFAEGGPGGGELADGEVAQRGGQRGEHEHHRPGREAAGQQQREGRQQPGRGQQRGYHGDGAEQPPGPPRILLRRRRRRYGIVCLSDPCGTWPMTHPPTIGPAVVWPARRTRNGPGVTRARCALRVTLVGREHGATAARAAERRETLAQGGAPPSPIRTIGPSSRMSPLRQLSGSIVMNVAFCTIYAAERHIH